jgi:hypothetical protein
MQIRDGKIRIWDPEFGMEITRIRDEHPQSANCTSPVSCSRQFFYIPMYDQLPFFYKKRNIGAGYHRKLKISNMRISTGRLLPWTGDA